MVDIDFAILYPATSYYLAVNMLVEFDQAGQVIPTRIDCLPYKIGAMADYCTSANATLDPLKFFLVLYTVYNSYIYFGKYGFSIGSLKEQFTDVTVIFL